ncbi:SUR7/PalI family-domain-containing protein [Microdochium trichocladiopsis]|uniref:SUR7/PalI family-domain-containing protein n=1 Tax=Microdochium trichocladiopsis TaxID=1682393 RepID=A0A9P9BQM1_9PEZI|nr:SUR7/PalI family-domain-containing protein [Microdochium trichocladiopsis]KAH7026022.1 SUR7/PalI family-domain-containing protein [Microdochium trichocladiopsis]
MGLLRGIHYLGSFLLLAATVLFVISSISAPVVNRISMMTVYLGGNADRSPSVTFGTFGWCVQNANGVTNGCSRSMVGYNIFDILANVVDGNDDRLEEWAAATANGLTNVMVLHPVTAGLAFISFVLSLTSGMFGGILAMLATLFTFIVALVVVVCDFVLFAYVRDQVRDAESNNWTMWGSASWTALAGMILIFIAFIITFITCCAGRREKKRQSAVVKESHHDYGTPARRRRFWQRR